MKQYNKPRKITRTLRPGLSGDDPSPRQASSEANHSASTDNSTRTTKRQNTQQRRL